MGFSRQLPLVEQIIGSGCIEISVPPLCLRSCCRYNISNNKSSYLKEDQNESFRFDETNCNNEFNFVCSCLSCDGIRICSQLRRNDIQSNYTADFKLYHNKRRVSVMENIPLLAKQIHTAFPKEVKNISLFPLTFADASDIFITSQVRNI